MKNLLNMFKSDNEFVNIQKNWGHPWFNEIKQFDLMNIKARNEAHKKALMKKYEEKYWHCWIDATHTRDKNGENVPVNTVAVMYRPSGNIKSEWECQKKWGAGVHPILQSIPVHKRAAISFEEVWDLVKL